MFERNTKILFQGDSITDGARSRDEDLNHVLGHGYVYLIAARLGAEWPDLGLRFVNRGCSGDRVTDLHARWNKDAIRHAPDVISILIGINDVWAEYAQNAGVSAAQHEEVYRRLLGETREALPRVRLVLYEPFVLPVGDRKDQWAVWKAEVDKRREIASRLATEHGAVLVRTQHLFEEASGSSAPENWLWDGVHPMPAGHELVARAWLSAVEAQGWGDMPTNRPAGNS